MEKGEKARVRGSDVVEAALTAVWCLAVVAVAGVNVVPAAVGVFLVGLSVYKWNVKLTAAFFASWLSFTCILTLPVADQTVWGVLAAFLVSPVLVALQGWERAAGYVVAYTLALAALWWLVPAHQFVLASFTGEVWTVQLVAPTRQVFTVPGGVTIVKSALLTTCVSDKPFVAVVV